MIWSRTSIITPLKCTKWLPGFIHKNKVSDVCIYCLECLLTVGNTDTHAQSIKVCCVKQGKNHWWLYPLLIVRVFILSMSYDGWLTLNFWEFKELDFTLCIQQSESGGNLTSINFLVCVSGFDMGQVQKIETVCSETHFYGNVYNILFSHNFLS